MNVEEIIKKAEANEGLTVEEVKIYQQAVKPIKHVYGKYGTLAKQYIEEHNFGKLLSLAGQLPEYLHGVDKAAEYFMTLCGTSFLKVNSIALRVITWKTLKELTL